jgi:hypothetical protein
MQRLSVSERQGNISKKILALDEERRVQLAQLRNSTNAQHIYDAKVDVLRKQIVFLV